MLVNQHPATIMNMVHTNKQELREFVGITKFITLSFHTTDLLMRLKGAVQKASNEVTFQ